MSGYSKIYDGEWVHVEDMDKCLKSIKVRYEDDQKRIKFLEERLKDLEDEKWKDNELQKIKSQLDRMKEDYYRGFPITEDEQKKIQEWQNKHDIEVHHLDTPERKMRAEGVSGGRLSYKFLPTSIGTFGTVKCSCGAEFDFQVAD
jgi:hypothetical protein